jgi:hypothetical protein
MLQFENKVLVIKAKNDRKSEYSLAHLSINLKLALGSSLEQVGTDYIQPCPLEQKLA